MGGTEWAWVLAAYVLGGFSTGYYWVRWRTGEDIREQGSGATGARNVGRRLGLPGFVVTLAFDGLKGGLTLIAASHFGVERPAMMLVLFAAIAGHIWPLQLRFKGGKGIAVSLGGLLAFHPPTFLILILLAATLWGWTRQFLLAGMAAYALTPVLVLLGGFDPYAAAAMSGSAVLVLWAHRRNLREELLLLSLGPASNRPEGRPREKTIL